MDSNCIAEREYSDAEQVKDDRFAERLKLQKKRGPSVSTLGECKKLKATSEKDGKR